MRNRLWYTSLLLLFFAMDDCLSQVSGVQSYHVEEAGKNVRFQCLLLSNEGFLLTGTSHGLYRFDGEQFYKFSFADTVKNPSVTAVAQQTDGKIWLGFENGEIGFLEDNSVRFLRAEEGHPAVTIKHIFIDSASVVYFATAGEGIYYYKNKRFYNINTDNQLSDNYVYQLAGNSSELMAATDRGVNIIRWKNGSPFITSFTSTDGLPDNIVRCLYSQNMKGGAGKSWWIGMDDKGVGTLQTSKSGVAFHSLLPWKYGQVHSLLFDQHELWAATESNGIIRAIINDDSAQVAKTGGPGSMIESHADNLVKDNEGNIWFTSKTKLCKTTGAQINLALPFDKGMFEEVHTMLVVNKDDIWMNANEGLYHYTYQHATASWSKRNINLPGITSKTDVTSLYQDIYGHIWAGTFGKGVIVIDPKTGNHRSINEDDLLVNGSVLSVTGKGKDIWISSLGGAVLCKLTEENRNISKPLLFTNYSNVAGIGSNYIYSILVDSKDRVWFATDGKGITVLNKGKFKHYGKEQGIESNVVYNICEDKVGNIWFSTLDGGVYKFDENVFTNINVRDGLLSQTITAMAVDENGNIITLCNKGINVIDPNTNQVAYFDANQGIGEVNTDLNCVDVNNGNVYFISRSGVVKFVPSFKKLQPKIALLQVQLFLNDINFPDRTVFDYDENNFTFSYTGISFSHPGKVKYQYLLEGLGDEWIITKDKSINFPKLPPGHYTFKVRASLNENFDDADEVSYSFIVQKPFWQQWWFIALCLILLAALVYWYMKTREKRLKRIDRIEKEKIQSQFETLKSQVNPHFLFNSFNTLLTVIEEDPHLAVEYVEHLSDLYRKIVTYRDKELIALGEELELIETYIFIQKKRFGKSLQLSVGISEVEKKRHLIPPLTLQLLCENAVKHNAVSRETPLIIDIRAEGNYLVVKNNINTRLDTEKGEGLGLQNIKRRYELLGNKEIKVVNTGKEFLVYIPLINEDR